ncbi:MAG: chemotaxis protein CheW [Bacteroidales bacterium]|nr:chemotaxis protein CheW [Bacteroidales bacterium]
MNEKREYVSFQISDQKYALAVSQVERVIHAVAITKTASVSKHIMGILNLGGRIVPVIDIRKQLELEAKEIELSDYLIIANTPNSTIAFFADQIYGTSRIRELLKSSSADGMKVYSDLIDDVVQINHEMVQICNLEKILLPHEKAKLDHLIEKKEIKVEEFVSSPIKNSE